MENVYENDIIISEGFCKSKSSVCLSESPIKFRAKTPSSSNEQEPSDLSQTTVRIYYHKLKKDCVKQIVYVNKTQSSLKKQKKKVFDSHNMFELIFK